MSALARARVRLPRLVIGTTFLLAILFAVGIEALAHHHHDSLSGSQQCPICQVVQTSANTPETVTPSPITLLENPCRPNDPTHLAPTSSHLVVLRLRAPPSA